MAAKLVRKTKVTKVTKQVSTSPKKTSRSKLTIFEEALKSIEIHPEFELPHSFVAYHSEEFIEGVKHIIKVDPSLYQLIVLSNFEWYSKGKIPADTDPETTVRTYWLGLIRSVVGQQIAGKAAKAIFGRFEQLFEKEPNPAEVLEKLHEELRQIGLSNMKVKYVTHISEVFSDPNQNLSQLNFYQESTPEVLEEELVKLKGIGPWSAKMFLSFTLHNVDVFAPGDLGVARGASYYLKLRPEMLKRIKQETHDNEEMLILLNKRGLFEGLKSKRDWVAHHDQYLLLLANQFKPYRTIFMLLLWRLSDTNVEVLEN